VLNKNEKEIAAKCDMKNLQTMQSKLRVGKGNRRRKTK